MLYFKGVLKLLVVIMFFNVLQTHGQTFEDISDQLISQFSYGINAEMGGGVTFVDFNKDGCEDLTFTSDSSLLMSFYLGQCDGSFVQINLSGIVNTGLTKHALWIDVDNDDDYDLFVSANDTGNRFYLNQGDLSFIDYTIESGIDNSSDNNSIGCVAADFNKDGNLDIYVSNRTIGGFQTPFSNIMYYGNGDGTFNDVTENTNTQDSFLAPLCPVVLDLEKDGYPDIYIAQDKNFGNTLLKNLDGENFISYQEESLSDFIMNGMNGEVIDINNDGFEDLYITNSNHGNKLLVNNQDGTFSEEGEERGIAMFDDFCWGGTFSDIDNDRDLDLYVCVSTLSGPGQDRFFLNDGNGFFEEATTEYGLGNINERSVGNLFCDVTSDGYPELVVRNYSENTNMFLNPGGTHNYFKYELEGTVSNRDGVGALVFVYIDGTPQVINHQCGRGWVSQSSYKKTVGLGPNSSADSIEIKWPSGMIDVHEGLLGNETYEFTEGETFAVEIVSSLGTVICAGSESVLSVVGEYESVIWNEEIESETMTVSSSGIYEVVVTNEFGFQATSFIEISIPNEVLDIEITGDLFICYDEFETEITANVFSEEDYSIFWDGELGADSIMLDIGEHILTVVNDLECEVSFEFEVIQTEELVYNELITHVTCHGENDGQLILDVNGANPFTILISGEESGILANNLTAGAYPLEITDNNGCIASDTLEVLEPDPVVYELTTSPDFGEAEGSITLFNISGGTEPYILNGDSIFELLNLNAGLFELELCDQNECCLEFDTLVEFLIGIDEELERDFILFPNPASTHINVFLPVSYSHRDLVIRDNQGKEIAVVLRDQTNNQLTLDVTTLAPSRYTLETIDGKFSKPFIVK